MGEENSQIVLIFILSAAFVVFLAIVLILFLVVYQKRIVTQENRLQKLENERQQVLLKATIEGQERERKRLAKDLHDGIGSLLSGLSLNLKFLKKRENPNSEQAAFLTEACEMVEEGIKNVRTVSHDLMPATLENFGLLSAMKECILPLTKSDTLSIQINSIRAPFRVSSHIELGLLRVFQELIQNTLKHSSATKIVVDIEYTVNNIQLNYSDNGKGLHLSPPNSNGIGMTNMQSRIQALDGVLYIDKKQKDGFVAQIEVPITSKETSHEQNH